MTKLTRRQFLHAATAAAGALVAACSGEGSAASNATQVPSTAASAASATAPPTAVEPPVATAAPTQAAAVPLEEKIGEMLMVGFEGTATSNVTGIAAPIDAGRLGNTVLFDRNVVSPGQLASLTDDLQQQAQTRLLIAIDQEGGYVARLRPDKGFPETVTALYLGNQHDLDVTYQHAASIARTLKTAGINLNLAPVVDVNVNPENPVIGHFERSFSSDPEVVARQALTWIKAHHDEGVMCTLKHFPGHGSSTADSHLGFVNVSDTWSREELIPFQRVIEAGQADVIMTAHIFNANLDPAYPATLSRATITGVLREQLGYDGVVVTDDMQMGAIRQYYGFDKAIELAINAGADIIAIANMLSYDPGIAGAAFDVILSAVRAGSISEARIDESYQRIRGLKSRLA